MGLVDQLPPISGAVEHNLLPPRRSHDLIVAEYGLPGRARMRGLDKRIGLIAELPFDVGKLKLRGVEADTAGGFSTEPAMHVVVAEILAGSAEITAAAASQHQGE